MQTQKGKRLGGEMMLQMWHWPSLLPSLLPGVQFVHSALFTWVANDIPQFNNKLNNRKLVLNDLKTRGKPSTYVSAAMARRTC